MKNKIQEITEQVTEYNDKINQLKSELRDQIRVVFHEGLKHLFREYPFIKNVHFTAYTPYFNDGDKCVYSCHHDYCGFNGWDGDEYEDVDYMVIDTFGIKPGENVFLKSEENVYVKVKDPDQIPLANRLFAGGSSRWECIPNSNLDPIYKEGVDSFREYFKLFSDENYRDLFGDHVLVLITENEILVDEYSHD